MSDSESIKKMLRSVLQSSKTGVSVNNLQLEYSLLCGEVIPLKKLGFSKLEDYLRSIPSVVRLEYRMGELRCFASVCEETAHIAQLVAKQKSVKKSGHSQVVNCKMRFKPSSPYVVNGTPRSSLRQPSAGRNSVRCSASGDYRKLDTKLSSITPVEHRKPSYPAVKQNVNPDRKDMYPVNSANKSPKVIPLEDSKSSKAQIGLYDVELVQSQVKQLLDKYSGGLWLSKLPEVYSKVFSQKLHPQALLDLEKWSHICLLEKSSTTNRADRLIYPHLPFKPLTSSVSVSQSDSSPTFSCPSTHEEISTNLPPFAALKTKDSPKSPLAKPTFIFPQQPSASGKLLPSVTLRSPAHNPSLAPQLPQSINHTDNSNSTCQGNKNLPTVTYNRNTSSLAPTWTCPPSTNPSTVASSIHPGGEILSLLKVTFSSPSHSAPCPPAKPSVVMSPDVRQKIKNLLSKCSQGVWAHALPKLFMDTYKMPFPEQILDNLSLLLDICTVEYPLPNDKKKAILYYSSREDMNSSESQENQQCRNDPLPSGLEVVGSVIPPCLPLPPEQYPSVLVTGAKSGNVVTIRYVGDNYSNAQEAMEENMQTFYSKNPSQHLVSNPIVGQLVAVTMEDGEEVARAQVMDVTNPNKIKVFYVDYGFSVETSGTNLLELHQDFLSLPLQATNVRLAGLEGFSSNLQVLSLLDKLAVGKILLMESLRPCQQNEVPVVVLYDTSQEEDVNINSMCLKALQDKTMNNPLCMNVTYQDVCVSNVCADGTIFCQLPSRGTARLRKLLEEIETHFMSQRTSESLVSRPFTKKFCLSRYQGKWARAEITNMYNGRVMDILFIDLGLPATVEVTDLREIPQLFLKNFIVIPPQAIKCRLADITVPEAVWSNEAVLWLNEAVLGAKDCKIKISKVEEYKGDKMVYVYMFIDGDGQDLHKSINCQVAQSELWQKVTAQNNGTVSSTSVVETERLTLSSPFPNTKIKASSQLQHNEEVGKTTKTTIQVLPLPPPLDLPQPGQNMDVFVPVVCHPGYFVVQPWQDLHKLVVLMGEMVLYYNQTENTTKAVHIQKGGVYAAKIDGNWQRVQVKAVLANSLVNVYELDHGKHELVSSALIQPLIEEFRQLPFQAVAAQLAGVTHSQWSEEASMLFRNYVEKKALVAQVESVQDVSEGKGELWERRLTVYLVDTSLEDHDLWIHSVMADVQDKLSTSA